MTHLSPPEGHVGVDAWVPRFAADGMALCISCDPTGSCRLGITDVQVDPNGIRTRVVCPAEGEGGPGVAHGGWIAAVFDDLFGQVAVQHHNLAVTASLSITFITPVRVGETIEAVATLGRQEGRKIPATAELRDAAGKVVARAECLLVVRRDDHYARATQ